MKILIVLDHYRSSYFSPHSDKVDYSDSKAGRELSQVVAMKSGLNVDPSTVRYDFAYPQLSQVNKYGIPKQITKGEVRKFRPKLNQDIFKHRPDLIIGMGQVANQDLMPKNSVTKNRGVPRDVTYTLHGKSIKIKTLVTFNIESTWVQPYKYSFIKSDFHTANRLIHHKQIGVQMKNYHYITDFSKVLSIFKKLFNRNEYKAVAVDTETNSLRPWLKGSKIIVFSLSWERNHGVCIPLYHKDTPWNAFQLKVIVALLNRYMMSDHYKVFHNGKYDIKTMMLTNHLPYARHCVDTLLMHYVGISEEQSISRGLKPLAIEYTTMGDYSKPLKDYKRKCEKRHYEHFLAEYKQNKIDRKNKKTTHKILKKDYQPLKNEVDGGDFNYEWIPLHILAPYAAMDTDATLRLYYCFRPYIDKSKKWVHLIFKLYPALENSLSRMEADGAHISMKQVAKLKPAYRKGIKHALSILRKDKYVHEVQSQKLNDLAKYNAEMAKPKGSRDKGILSKYRKFKGRRKDPMEKVRFNPNSTADVKAVLDCADLAPKIPYDKDYMTSSAISDHIDKKHFTLHYMSAGKQTLNYLVTNYHSEFCKALLKYKKLYKLYNDFICKLPKMCDRHDLLHGKFIMSGTVTHRLASRGPNMQQIPAADPDPHDFNFHYPVKSMITSRYPHGQIINFDFKSFEVFVVTALCGEQNLVSALCNGYDAHKTNAARAFNIPYDKVTPSQRKKAKKVTFGCLYGISIPGLADQLHTDKDNAKTLYNRVLGALPQLKKYMEQVHQFCDKYHYVETLDGFRRRLKGAGSPKTSVHNRAMRESLNAIVQGSTTYFIGLSIIIMQEVFRRLHMKSKLIITVHDSIVMDSPADEVAQATRIGISIMQNLPVKALNRFKIKDYKNIPKKLWHKDGTFEFPFVSNAGIGDNYNDLVPFDYKHFKKIPAEARYDYLILQYGNSELDSYHTYKVFSDKDYKSKKTEMNSLIKQYLNNWGLNQ